MWIKKKNSLATGIRNGRYGGAGYTCWSPRLLLLSPRHSDRHFPRCFSCRNYKQSSQLVLKNHPVSRGRGFRAGGKKKKKMSSFQSACSFLDLISGSASTIGTKFMKRFGQLLTPSCPSKIIFLHFSKGKVKKKKQQRQTRKHQVFSSPPFSGLKKKKEKSP